MRLVKLCLAAYIALQTRTNRCLFEMKSCVTMICIFVNCNWNWRMLFLYTQTYLLLLCVFLLFIFFFLLFIFALNVCFVRELLKLTIHIWTNHCTFICMCITQNNMWKITNNCFQNNVPFDMCEWCIVRCVMHWRSYLKNFNNNNNNVVRVAITQCVIHEILLKASKTTPNESTMTE